MSETLTFSNLSDSTVTYTVALESDLPAGVTITADRSSVVLGPGESAEVIVGLSVDNTVVPNPPEQPFSYEGAVVATSEDETLRVPFSFIKSPVINFTFDENPWIVLVHNRGGKSIFLANPGTSLQLPVPGAGTYDVIVTFNDVAIRVVVEGLEVETATEVDIFTTHATHEITIAPVDSDGRPLSLGIGGEYFTHKDSGQGLIFIFGFPMERHFSDISNAYSWEWTITESDRSNEAVYNFNGFANDGVNGDMLFQNEPSQLKKMTFDYSVPPDAEKVRLQHWISDGPSGGISFAYTATSEAYALPAPFMRDLYFMPIPYPDSPFGYFFEDLWPLDPETGLTGNLFARTPYLAAPDVETLEGCVFGATEDPVLTTTSSSLSVALPPPTWFGRFDNTVDRVQLRGAKVILVRLFLDQTRGMKPHSDLTYELYQGDSLIGSGDLEGAGGVWGGPSSVVVPVTTPWW